MCRAVGHDCQESRRSPQKLADDTPVARHLTRSTRPRCVEKAGPQMPSPICSRSWNIRSKGPPCLWPRRQRPQESRNNYLSMNRQYIPRVSAEGAAMATMPPGDIYVLPLPNRRRCGSPIRPAMRDAASGSRRTFRSRDARVDGAPFTRLARADWAPVRWATRPPPPSPIAYIRTMPSGRDPGTVKWLTSTASNRVVLYPTIGITGIR